MSLELIECPHCKVGHTEQTYIDNLKVCPNCGYHLRMDAWERVNYIADKDSFEELYQNLSSNNPIEMEGYTEKLQAAKEKTSLEDAVLTGSCTINERKALLGVMSFAFMGGYFQVWITREIEIRMISHVDDSFLICRSFIVNVNSIV